jgi:hypothetical protein
LLILYVAASAANGRARSATPHSRDLARCIRNSSSVDVRALGTRLGLKS